MNATLTRRQVQLVGLLVLVVVAAGGFLVVHKHKTTTPSTASSTPAVTTPAQTTPAQTTPAPGKAHAHAVTPVKLDTHGLPVKVALALRQHAVVVVFLTAPRGEDDAATSAEALAGAVEMHAGFVAIDVFHQRPGTAILHKLGVVQTPTTLVVTRRGITSQFPGFVDHDVVAQAVADAR